MHNSNSVPLIHNAPAQGSHSSQLNQRHSYSRQIAKDYGINSAVLLQFLAVTINYNESQGKVARFFHSLNKLAVRYPYIPRSTIADCLNRLRDKNVLSIDCGSNKKKWDHTAWYSFKNQTVYHKAHIQDDVVYFGVQEAINHSILPAVLLNKIAYDLHQKRNEDPSHEWYRVSASELARLLKANKQTVQRALDKLCRPEGPLERSAVQAPDKTYAYRFRDRAAFEHQIAFQTVEKAGDTHSDSDDTNPDHPGSNPSRSGTISDGSGSNPYDNTFRRDLEANEYSISNSIDKEKSCAAPPLACLFEKTASSFQNVIEEVRP